MDFDGIVTLGELRVIDTEKRARHKKYDTPSLSRGEGESVAMKEWLRGDDLTRLGRV